MGTTPIASAADRTAADRTHNPPRDMSSIRITGFAFLLFATLLHAQEDAYVNEVLPEHELTEMSTQEVPSENAKLQAALNEIDDPQLLHLLQQRKNHAQKLTDTIAQKSKIVQAVNNIVTKLKSGYDSHKTTAQKAIDRLSVAKNQITDAQFKPLAAGAMVWCAARKTQLEKQKLLGQAKKEMDVKQKVEIPAAVLQWQAATTWRIDYKKGQTYTSKPFTPSSALQSAYNTARQAFWEKSKKKFEADETHNTAIDKSNNAAVAFKTSIDTLADEEVAACGKYDKIAEKAIVEAFNTANAQRSGVRRALQIVLCHANNLGEADPTNKAAQCISNTVKTKTNYNTNVYKNLDVPSVSCPTKEQVLASIKAKKSTFNFHFKKGKTLLATDTGGELVADQGWTPTSKACAEVNKHPIKGQKCKDVACPTGKMKKSGVADKYAPSPTLCCEAPVCGKSTIVNPAYSRCKASSVWANNAIGHSHGTGRLDSNQGWSARHNQAGQWWQMDLGNAQQVAGVVTQGRTQHEQYVKSYKVQTSQDGSSWSYVDGGKIFGANKAWGRWPAPNNVKVENRFASPVSARFVRIVVQTWNSGISMRAAVLVCAA